MDDNMQRMNQMTIMAIKVATVRKIFEPVVTQLSSVWDFQWGPIVHKGGQVEVFRIDSCDHPSDAGVAESIMRCFNELSKGLTFRYFVFTEALNGGAKIPANLTRRRVVADLNGNELDPHFNDRVDVLLTQTLNELIKEFAMPKYATVRRPFKYMRNDQDRDFLPLVEYVFNDRMALEEYLAVNQASVTAFLTSESRGSYLTPWIETLTEGRYSTVRISVMVNWDKAKDYGF